MNAIILRPKQDVGALRAENDQVQKVEVKRQVDRPNKFPPLSESGWGQELNGAFIDWCKEQDDGYS